MFFFDVLKYYLEDGSWIVIWLLGIELKIKFYLVIKVISSLEVFEKIVVFEVVVNELIK